MLRITTTLALILGLIGCGSESPGEPVELETVSVSVRTCHPYPYAIAHLSADPTAGIVARPVDGTSGNLEVTGALVWPSGYVGRRDGPEVVVYDENGTEKARTGRDYVITSYTALPGSPQGPFSPTFGRVVAACIFPWEGGAAAD